MRPPDLPLRLRRIAFTFVGLLAVAGCSGGGGDLDDDGDITGPDTPDDPEAGAYAALAVASDLDVVLVNLLMPGGPLECVTTTTPWEDSDQDGVPDDLTYVFSLDGCRYDLEGGSWGSTSGTARIVDPGASWGMDVTLQDYGYWTHLAQEDPPRTLSREHTGTTHLSGSGLDVAFGIDHDVRFEVTGQPDATLAEEWTGTWTPAGADPFAFTLVPGSLTLQGSTRFLRGGVEIRLSLETVTPLRWDAACDAVWPQAGEIRARVESGAPAGYLAITWSGCWRTSTVDFVAS